MQLKLKQASIAQRLLLIKREMFKLDKELRAPNELPAEQSSSFSEVDPVPPSDTKEDLIGQFDSLKERMLHVYQSKGFKVLSSHLKHLSKPADPDLSDLLNKLTQ